MRKRRVALLCARQLLCESLQHTLGSDPTIEVLGPWAIDDHATARITQSSPDMVLIAESLKRTEQVAKVTARILANFPDLPMIRVTLENNLMRFYSAQTMPASSDDLMTLIHSAIAIDRQELE